MRIPADLSPGSIVEGRLRLLPLQGPVRPGGYDFSFHAYFDGVGATGFFLGSPKPVAAQRPAGGAARWRLSIEVLRHRLTERIRERLQGPEGELAAALITGAQAGIPETVNEALRRSGLAHILSISGLHMALVAGTVMAALRLAFACFPVFASRYPVRKFAAGAALAVLCLYLFISGAAVATVRSAIMLAVMLVAVIADRPAITMRSLAVAALIILAIHPHEVTDPGFQMSFAATAALIAAYRAWADRSRFRRRGAAEPDRSGPGALLARLLLAVAGLAATSFVAGAATGIFGIWHFHRVAPFGLAANLAAMPVVSMAVMPLALVSVLLIPFDLDGPAFGLLGGSIAVVVEIAEGFSQLTAYDTVGAISAWTLIAASLGLILATLPAGRLKLCALPCLAAAAFGVSSRSLPDLLVSEDARLVAIRREDGRLAVNRERPEAFTIGVWSRAAAATAGLTGPKAGRGPLDSAPAMDGRSGPAFQCEAGLCAARLADGAIIVHAADAGTARGACAYAFMIVVAEAVPAERICKGGKSLPGPAVAGHPPARGGRDEARNRRNRKPARHVERQGSPAERETGNGPIVLTAIDLARRGAMELRLQASDSGTERPAPPSGKAPVLRFAIGLPWRPWHAHRAWSREARGLPPYVPPQGASSRTSPVPPAGKP
jgi:competence protein ComEC